MHARCQRTLIRTFSGHDSRYEWFEIFAVADLRCPSCQGRYLSRSMSADKVRASRSTSAQHRHRRYSFDRASVRLLALGVNDGYQPSSAGILPLAARYMYFSAFFACWRLSIHHLGKPLLVNDAHNSWHPVVKSYARALQLMHLRGVFISQLFYGRSQRQR